MIVLRWLLAFALLPFVGTTAVAGAAAAQAATCSEQVVQQTLHVADASAPGGTREVLVFRPPGSDAASIPVLYFLHGGPGEASDIYQADIVDLLDQQLCAGNPMVFAVPDGTTVNHPDGSWWDNEWADDSSGSHAFDLETFITGPLVTAVEGSHTRTSSERAIGGFSMGGFGAAAIALRHPSLYGSVIGIAGYYTQLEDPDHALGTTTAGQDHHLPSLIAGNGKGQHWFLADGADENNPVVIGQMHKMQVIMADEKADVTAKTVPGEHTWQMVSLALTPAFDWWATKT